MKKEEWPADASLAFSPHCCRRDLLEAATDNVEKINQNVSWIFALCLKITEKVSFNIGSEASYVYILSGQKLIKNAKNGPFWRVFENLKFEVKQCYQTCQFE